jgi:hypothetical protein
MNKREHLRRKSTLTLAPPANLGQDSENTCSSSLLRFLQQSSRTKV